MLIDFVCCGGREGQPYASRCTAFLLSRDKPVTRIEIGPAKPIDQAITAWRADPDGAVGDASSALRRLVWEPIEKALPADTRAIYICPDGDLARLPWAALPGRVPGSVVLEDYAVAVVPSGQFLLEQLTAASPADEAGRLLAIGGVSYDARPSQAITAAGMVATGAAAMDEGSVRWKPLEGAARELAVLDSVAGKRTCVELTGAEAGTSRAPRVAQRAVGPSRHARLLCRQEISLGAATLRERLRGAKGTFRRAPHGRRAQSAGARAWSWRGLTCHGTETNSVCRRGTAAS